jgi:catechol 2,3-dioxygenase-like lactoylglutathione lyase family enzyme
MGATPGVIELPLHAASCTPGPERGITVGILNDIHAVADLDKTLAFYKDVFGISGAPRAFPNPGVPLLTNAPGVSLRLAVMKLPNAPHGFELTDFTGVEKQAGRARLTDPGAAALDIYVSDLDQVVAAAQKGGYEIVTTSGRPVQGKWPSGKFGSKPFHTIILRDPDGYFVRATQKPDAPTAAEGNAQGVAMDFTAESLETTRKFYGELLGFNFCETSWVNAAGGFDQLLGGLAKNAKYRMMNGKIPGTTAAIQFTEYKGMPRSKFHLRVRDPGAPAMCLQVKDLDGVLKRMKDAGVPVVSKDEKIVQFSPTVRNIFVVDPNGINLELYEVTPAPAKPTASN